MPFLLSKNGILTVLVASLLALGGYCYLQYNTLQQQQVVYRNPITIERVKTVKVSRPVTIRTVVVTEKDKRTEITEEHRGAVTEGTEAESIKQPLLPQPQAPKWLLGGGVNPFDYSSEWQVHAGYSFFNRIDLCVGYRNPHTAITLLTFRF